MVQEPERKNERDARHERDVHHGVPGRAGLAPDAAENLADALPLASEVFQLGLERFNLAVVQRYPRVSPPTNGC